MSRRTVAIFTVFVLVTLVVAMAGVCQDIALPRTVPAFNQAYTDGADAWGDCPLGTFGCPDDVCTTGCLVTAFSSVIAYYEIAVTVPASSSCTGQERSGMDPGIFNDWLRDTGGYGRCAQDPIGNCCLIWEQLPDQLEITTHENRSDVGLNPVSSVVIDHALRLGYPVVAGVHWGAFCNGGSTQSEDCHWVILTGKRDGIYTIIDPFNPDSTSPYGVQTTLDNGVHGAYVIDRFVIVTGPAPNEVNLQVSRTPQKGTYEVGEVLRWSMSVPGRLGTWIPFARATMPSGRIAYASLNRSGSLRFGEDRRSLVPEARMLQADWIWQLWQPTDADVGRWHWEFWVERADDAGTKLGRLLQTFDIRPAAGWSSIGTALLGVVLVAAIAVVAILATLNAPPE